MNVEGESCRDVQNVPGESAAAPSGVKPSLFLADVYWIPEATPPFPQIPPGIDSIGYPHMGGANEALLQPDSRGRPDRRGAVSEHIKQTLALAFQLLHFV